MEEDKYDMSKTFPTFIRWEIIEHVGNTDEIIRISGSVTEDGYTFDTKFF